MKAARAAVTADSPAAEGPESDRIEGAPHPRKTLQLFGQEAAQAEFLAALAGGRLHHAWLLTGPRGIGKATLAWRMARLLLSLPVPGAPAANPTAADDGPGLFGDLALLPAPRSAPSPAPIPQSLDIAADHPVARRIAALSEPGLALVRRSLDDKTGALRSQILVDDIRRLKHFFTLTASDGGRRVAIIDCADEMNGNAANALLKLLEEPPPRATLILIAHQPARLLATIRSRCRVLRLAPLGPDAIAQAIAQANSQTQAADPDHPGGGALSPADQAGLAALAHGSAGEALRLLAQDGLAIYRQILALLGQAPRIDRLALASLAETAQGRANADRFDMILGLLDLFLARLARGGLGVWGPAPAAGQPPEAFQGEAFPGEAALIARLCPDTQAARLWAEAQQALGARARQGRAVNLDPAALLVDMVLQLNAIAGRTAIRG